MRPRLVVTSGDPSGIGPEVAVQALAGWPDRSLALLVGEAHSLEGAIARHAPDTDIPVLALEGLEPAAVGQVSAAGGLAAMAILDAALERTLAGTADAIVTGPVNKAAVREAGFSQFEGHTEYLAQRAGVEGRVAMLLDSDRLRVVHVSTHRSLRSATELDPARVDLVIDLAAAYLRQNATGARRIFVAGLNPHAGEDGAFGDDEQTVIMPAVARACERHPDIEFVGPVAPDTCFLRALDAPATVVLAMYHDQGHIPVKLVARHRAVNVTLGLPFVRTSVDHGTAHDIAGLGRADPSPMRAALDAAVRLARARCRSSVS